MSVAQASVVSAREKACSDAVGGGHGGEDTQPRWEGWRSRRAVAIRFMRQLAWAMGHPGSRHIIISGVSVGVHPEGIQFGWAEHSTWPCQCGGPQLPGWALNLS